MFRQYILNAFIYTVCWLILLKCLVNLCCKKDPNCKKTKTNKHWIELVLTKLIKSYICSSTHFIPCFEKICPCATPQIKKKNWHNDEVDKCITPTLAPYCEAITALLLLHCCLIDINISDLFVALYSVF